MTQIHQENQEAEHLPLALSYQNDDIWRDFTELHQAGLGWCWGEALGLLNLGTNRTKNCLGGTFPRAPPWERHRTQPAADTTHHECHNWFVWWSFGSCTNYCWFCSFFFRKDSPRAEISHRKWKSSRKKVWEVVMSKRSDCTQLGGYSRYNWQHLKRDFTDSAESECIWFWIFNKRKPQGKVI